MRFLHKIPVIILLAVAAVQVVSAAQSTGLTIQINPEAHLDVTSVPLTFEVSSTGAVTANAPVPVTAWVRALPGQQIFVTAEVDSLNGPQGAAPVARVGWTGVAGRATGGGVAASCTSGSFADGAVQQMIAGWSQSGIATCRLQFELTPDASWAAGTYTGHVSLKVIAQ